MWSDSSQMFRDLCDRINFPVPTAMRVEAERADVQDQIRIAADSGDVDRVEALEKANKDLLDEDREAVLERLVTENRQAGEQGDVPSAQAAVRYQKELDEYRRFNTADIEPNEEEEGEQS
jgi:hypothetical protein